MSFKFGMLTTSAAALAVSVVFAAPAFAGVGACLITKTDTNPFFVKMREGAKSLPSKLASPMAPRAS